VPVDPEVQAVLDEMAAADLPALEELTPDEARAASAARFADLPPGPDLPSVEDRTVPGPAGAIPVRVYTPEGEPPFPVIVYFHGGGWVVGDLDTLADPWARSLAAETGAVVVSVDYRLAPEHPFPAAVDDCYAATEWIAGHGTEIGVDGGRLAVAGDSAGGNLAAVVALRARDRDGPRISFQALGCPVIDHDFTTGSYRDCSEGFFLERTTMEWFWDHYVSDVSGRDDPEVSPLRADSLAGLPPALVITAEYDPLRDEGDAYAARLREAGVPVAHHSYDGMTHCFYVMPFTRSKGTLAAAAAEIRAALS
jgi:acetyl esterase/lipase